MVVINDYVTRKGTTNPTGVIKDIQEGIAKVHWGVQDGRSYSEKIPVENLVVITHPVYSPDEVVKRQAEAAGGKLKVVDG